MPTARTTTKAQNCRRVCGNNQACLRDCLRQFVPHTPSAHPSPGPGGFEGSPWLLRRADGRLQWLPQKDRPEIVQLLQDFDANSGFTPDTPEFFAARAAFFAERGLVIFEIGNLVQASELAPDDLQLQAKLDEALQKIPTS